MKALKKRNFIGVEISGIKKLPLLTGWQKSAEMIRTIGTRPLFRDSN